MTAGGREKGHVGGTLCAVWSWACGGWQVADEVRAETYAASRFGVASIRVSLGPWLSVGRPTALHRVWRGTRPRTLEEFGVGSICTMLAESLFLN